MKSIRNALLLSAALALPLAPSLAFADDHDDDQITRFTFNDDLVRGDLVSPDGEIFHARRRGSRDSLIRVRENFIAELYKSVENL